MTTQGALCSETIARLMLLLRQGDPAAVGKLVEFLYPELHRLASRKLRGEHLGHSWQPTVLVNELYLQLIRIKALQPVGATSEEEKAAFLGLAERIMKRLLIHHARPLSRRAEKVEFHENAAAARVPNLGTTNEVEGLLRGLEAINPKLRSVVELKVFQGLTVDEIAAQIGCAQITVKRYWSFAKQWLAVELG